MYKILECSNGQPVIFEPDGENIVAYTIVSGRVHSKGKVFKDVKSDFITHQVNIPLVSYRSVDKSLIIIQASPNDFKEKLALTERTCLIEHSGYLFIFYLVSNGDFFDLKCTRSDDFAQSIVLLSGLRKNYILNSLIYNNKIGIVTEEMMALIFDDLHLDKVLRFERSTNTAKKMNDDVLKDKVIHSSIDNKAPSQNQNNNLMLNYQHLQREHKEIVYSFNTLKEQNSKLQMQYNKLSDYTGQLQEQIRKLKVSIR